MEVKRMGKFKENFDNLCGLLRLVDYVYFLIFYNDLVFEGGCLGVICLFLRWLLL